VAKAELLFHQRIDYDDGAIVEMLLAGSFARFAIGPRTEIFAILWGFGRSDRTMNAERAIIGTIKALRPFTPSGLSSS
jgi:hypothetical protein